MECLYFKLYLKNEIHLKKHTEHQNTWILVLKTPDLEFKYRKRLHIVTVTIFKEYLIVTVTTFRKYLIVTVTISKKYLIVTVTMFKGAPHSYIFQKNCWVFTILLYCKKWSSDDSEKSPCWTSGIRIYRPKIH